MRILPGMDIPDRKMTPVDDIATANYPNEGIFQKFAEKQFRYAMGGIAEPWKCYHTWRSTNSTGGFPDLVCAHHEAEVTLAAELKTESGTVKDNQRSWLLAFAANPANDVFLWRPSDIPEMMDYLQSVIEKVIEKRGR